MKAPDKVFIPSEYIKSKILPVGVTKKQIFKDDICYIRKDALLELAKERYNQTLSNVGCYTGHSVWTEVIDKLNSL